MNNKGFTLIELLGVVVVLTLILLIAIPSITTTYERNKNKINDQKKEVILSAAEIYANRYKKSFDYDTFLEGNCGIPISELLDKDLVTNDELISSDGSKLTVKIDNTTVEINNQTLIRYNNGNFEFSNTNSCF